MSSYLVFENFQILQYYVTSVLLKSFLKLNPPLSYLFILRYHQHRATFADQFRQMFWLSLSQRDRKHIFGHTQVAI